MEKKQKIHSMVFEGKEYKFLPNARFFGALNPDGSEIVNEEKKVIPLDQIRGMSADQKLKQMLHRELAKDREREESMLDSFDFEVPDEETPDVSQFQRHTQFNKKEFQLGFEKLKNKKVPDRSDAQDSGGRKPAQTGRAQRVEPDKNPKKGKSASESSLGNEADETQEDSE